jgi:Raf kinase inhibitor-like YbhB/YbcL family protein
MKIVSPAFEFNKAIPAKYTCDGENINPPLIFSDVPKISKSLVLIMEDPDVPTSIRPDGMWDHWVMFNISSVTQEVVEGREPAGVPGKNTGGNLSYSGPCPPDREHRYYFKIFALDTLLDIPAGVTKQDVIRAMDTHILDSAELVGRYVRK